eukprot:CCRYP_009731-RA/>CCRYP_009731-RA protein AED:0.26 eAED:1.00 QI:0/-1/0/1/-1/0/1/0/30
MKTCVRSMSGGSPSCRKTCNLHWKYEGSLN